jgi:hypothetical protein
VILRSRFGRSNALATAAALAAAASGGAQPLPDGVGECLVRIEQQRAAGEPDDDEVGPRRLGDACPELADAIDAGAWGEGLVDVSAAGLSTAAFAELARLVASYEQAPPAGAQISAGSLDDALAALELREPEAQESLWQRVRKWLDERLGSRDGAAGRWIDDWLGNLSVPERVVRYLLIVLGAALVLATAAVIVNELRIAGVLAGGALRKYAPRAARGADDEVRARTFDDVARAPLARRPALLLMLVLERLRARAKAPLRDSLTHRELVAAAEGLNAEQSDALRAVAGAAERATFGEWRPEEHAVEDVVARGRALVASLEDERKDPA